MRKDFELCHIFPIGMGGNRRKGHGVGCSCEENKIVLTPYEHDCLDFRTYHHLIEEYKVKNRKALNKMPRSYRHKRAFGVVFGRVKYIQRAIIHYEMRNKGLTSCCKWKS